MDQKDQSLLDAFQKNPDGTWTSIRATSLKVGTRVIAIGEGMTFTKGEPFLFVDVAATLDEQSQ